MDKLTSQSLSGNPEEDFRVVSVNFILKIHPKFKELTSSEYYKGSKTEYLGHLGEDKERMFYFLIPMSEFKGRLSKMMAHGKETGRDTCLEFTMKPNKLENIPEEFRQFRIVSVNKKIKEDFSNGIKYIGIGNDKRYYFKVQQREMSKFLKLNRDKIYTEYVAGGVNDINFLPEKFRV